MFTGLCCIFLEFLLVVIFIVPCIFYWLDGDTGVQWETVIAYRKTMKQLLKISSELFNWMQDFHMGTPFVVMSMALL